VKFSQDQNAGPVAYCAPGNKAVAEVTLALAGELVEDIIEHPYLEGHSSTLVFYRRADFWGSGST
jgi:hypothetical protein